MTRPAKAILAVKTNNWPNKLLDSSVDPKINGGFTIQINPQIPINY